MYHFMATCAPEPLEVSEKVQIPGHVRQYLKDFQLETLRFLHKHLANRDFCILNDESGLGKCVSTAVYLGAIAKNKTCLIVVQNDDELVASWQFHFDVLTNLTVGVLGSNTGILESPPNVIIAKWATLRSTIDGNKFNYDYIIIDNRGQMMSNNFCMSMLLSNYEHKVNLIISSNDVTSDLKLLHNSLRLGGRLEHQYEQFKVFEAKYKLPDSKDVLNKIADLEQYFLKREMISDFCKDFRLRRYRHQYEDELPLVDAERYKINLDLWRSNSSQKSNDNVNNLNANSETPTEELFNQALALDREITHIIDGQKTGALVMANNEASDDALSMSPLLIDSDSCNSDDAEAVVDITHQEISLPPQNKSPAPDIYEFVDLSTEKCSEEYVSSVSRAKPNTAKKTTETRSNSRSPVQKSNNIKTIVIKDTEEIDSGKELTKSQPNRKKTKLQASKKVLEKKTNGKPADKNDNPNEGLNTCVEEKATNVNDINKNATVAKRQMRNKNVIKQNVIAESQTSQVKANNTDTITTTKRRTLKQPEKYVKQTANKIISTDKTKLATTAKLKNLDQSHKNEETLKTIDKAVERTSPSKLNQAKLNTDKSVRGKDQTLDEKTAVSKEKEVKSKQNVSESIETPRRLRQTRGDKTDVRKDKEAVRTEKVTPAIVESRNTTKKAPESDKVNENKSAKNSPKDSPKNVVVKQNVKPKSKNNTRVDVPTTPTARNTRSMQRQTRSTDAGKSKYMKSPLILDDNRKPKRKRARLEDGAKAGTKAQQEDESSSVEAETTSKRKKNEKEKIATENNSHASGKTAQGKSKKRQTNNKIIDTTDSAILPCSGNTEDMQCGQKIIADTHSDDGFLRPPAPVRNIRNSEPKNFLPTPISINDSEVVFVPCTDAPHKNQSIVVLSSSTDEGSLSSQHSVQSRRTRALKQKTALKRPATDITNTSPLPITPTFGELLAKQRMQRKSPDLFSASTELGLTCTQQTASDRHDGAETFQGFKIFGSEVKQIQQQNAQTAGGEKSKQMLSRGRSCLNILEKMFDTPAAEATDAAPTAQAQTQTQPKTKTTNTQKSTKKAPDGKLVKRATRGSQPVMPTLPNAVSATQQQHEKSKQTQNNDTATNQVISGALVDEEIFEITNNDAFGSVMRINSNGEISPVQTTARGLQPTQHNKITNYLIGTTQLTPTEATMDERTPSKRTQTPLSGTVTRRSPKNKSTQSTKLTKWFQKNGALNDLQANATQNDPNLRTHSRNTMAKRLKRRCLELSFRN